MRTGFKVTMVTVGLIVLGVVGMAALGACVSSTVPAAHAATVTTVDQTVDPTAHNVCEVVARDAFQSCVSAYAVSVQDVERCAVYWTPEAKYGPVKDLTLSHVGAVQHLSACFGSIVAGDYTQMYSTQYGQVIEYGDSATPNQGFMIKLTAINAKGNVQLHTCGWETRGNPGYFCDVE